MFSPLVFSSTNGQGGIYLTGLLGGLLRTPPGMQSAPAGGLTVITSTRDPCAPQNWLTTLPLVSLLGISQVTRSSQIKSWKCLEHFERSGELQENGAFQSIKVISLFYDSLSMLTGTSDWAPPQRGSQHSSQKASYKSKVMHYALTFHHQNSSIRETQFV